MTHRKSAAVDRFTQDEIISLAANAVTKVDLLGERGATLCTQNEIIALTVLVAASGSIPPLSERTPPKNPNLTPKGMKS
ncbi:hypothetical protein [Cognatiyoonia sp. IB215182]|uniref:hypothetical protein n=1 Tax=Cognatiyoonia sp. IB215182 TaxID=3097353 RepID=UPI002A168E01|nr:hypothetical protein [Cognatiyoonia sp. IB215182]MDX8354330.1 hypothetical protein [Cognatiyoonia sp. IB215182]